MAGVDLAGFGGRRALLSLVVVVGAVAFGVGGYTAAELHDTETGSLGVGAADRVSASVTFAGCGQVRLRPVDPGSFTADVVVRNRTSGQEQVVTLAPADAGNPGTGFERTDASTYRFTVQRHAAIPPGSKPLRVLLDGETFRNPSGCANAGGPPGQRRSVRRETAANGARRGGS